MSMLNCDVFTSPESTKDSNTTAPLVNNTSESTDPPKRKRGRPRKSEQQSNSLEVSPSSNIQQQNSHVPMCQSDESYENNY